MLRKLIKQEFRATARLMLPLYIAVILLGVGSKFAEMALNSADPGGVVAGFEMPGEISSILDILSVLVIAGFVIALIAAFAVAFVLMILRFRNNLLGDEGYVMFTLPVSVHQLVWAKLIVSLVWFVGAVVVDGAAILLVLLGDEVTLSEVFRAIGSFFSQLSPVDGGHLVGFGVEGLLLVVVLTFACCLEFYAAMSIGHSFARHKGLLSVAFFFVIQGATQLLSSLPLLAGDSLNRVVESLSFTNTGMVHAVLISVLVANILYAAVLYFITTYMLKNRLNPAKTSHPNRLKTPPIRRKRILQNPNPNPKKYPDWPALPTR